MLEETIIQGDSIRVSVQLKDATSGAPINLTGATARMAVVDSLGVSKYLATTNLITEPLEGKIYHLVPITVTTVAVGTELFSDIEITYPTGVVKTYAQITYTIAIGYTNG